MNYYFVPSTEQKFQGQKRRTLPVTIHNDIILTNKLMNMYGKYKIDQLNNINDLETLSTIASDKFKWKLLTDDIYKAAEADLNIIM